MRFTRDEFDVMVNELLCKDPISFDMLCQIAEKTLRSSVTSGYFRKFVSETLSAETDKSENVIKIQNSFKEFDGYR